LAAFLVSAALSKKLHPSQSWYFASSIVSSRLFFLARAINLLSGSSLGQSRPPQSGGQQVQCVRPIVDALIEETGLLDLGEGGLEAGFVLPVYLYVGVLEC
jgi:hypothetical protein